jgi:hypothetical protein
MSNAERERLAARIRELFDEGVRTGRSPNDSAADAAQRAAQEARLESTCAALFNHVDEQVSSLRSCACAGQEVQLC